MPWWKESGLAWVMATGAWAARREADGAIRSLAPTWPAHRQPAVDRALIRLAHWEMTAGGRPPRAVVSEVVEIAKSFSTDRSPGFINAVLDKVLKQVLAEGREADAGDATSTSGD